jgi:acetylornithine deacetylase/succinyl-diaminopimelate desuccinylase-like protein
VNADALAYARASFRQFVGDLREFVAIPSVSTDPAWAADVRHASDWLAAALRRAGLAHVETIQSRGNRVVYAESALRPDLPTVLIYGHYDVQPADRPEAWRTPPFEPSIRGPDLFARGASDDKGQLLVHVKAAESLLASRTGLPVNLKYVFEGAEEVGSPGLREVLAGNRRRLAADVAVLSDTRMLGPGRPALTYSLRGSLSCEVEARTLGRDVHSGGFGGAIRNPIEELARLLAGLHDRDGKIAIHEFYGDVRPVTAEERRFMASQGPTDETILAEASALAGWGEPGFTAYERTTIRPSLAVTGISGGYRGPGIKAVIPAVASAKLNFRLVSAQNPNRVGDLVRRHFRSAAPAGVRVSLRMGGGAAPVELSRRGRFVAAAADGYRLGFGRPPVFLRSGGTVPIVDDLRDVLGLPVVLMGFALPDDGAHAPNEKVHLPSLLCGVVTVIEFLERVGASHYCGMRDQAREVATRVWGGPGKSKPSGVPTL